MVGKSQGQGLIGVLMVALIVALFATFVGTSLLNLIRGHAHLDIKSDIAALRIMLMDSIDCNATLNGVNFATDCISSNQQTPPTYLQLRRNSALFGNQSITGNAPQNADGSYLVAGWKVRSYCDATLPSLIVEIAKPGPSAAGFAFDPLTRRELSYQKILGGGLNWICGPLLAGNNYTVVQTDLQFQGATCAFPGGGLGEHYTSLISCPAGTKVLGGGGRCELLGGGYTLESRIAGANNDQWFIDCCAKSRNGYPPTMVDPNGNGTGWATCANL